MKYRKKPVVVEASQFRNGKTLPDGICNCSRGNMHVHTIHDDQAVEISLNDWIVTEPDGIHFYPVKPDIFDQTYEPVEEK